MSSKDSEREQDEEKVKLSWKDYVGFVIALLQTTLLPFVLMILTLLAILAIILLLT